MDTALREMHSMSHSLEQRHESNLNKAREAYVKLKTSKKLKIAVKDNKIRKQRRYLIREQRKVDKLYALLTENGVLVDEDLAALDDTLGEGSESEGAVATGGGGENEGTGGTMRYSRSTYRPSTNGTMGTHNTLNDSASDEPSVFGHIDAMNRKKPLVIPSLPDLLGNAENPNNPSKPSTSHTAADQIASQPQGSNGVIPENSNNNNNSEKERLREYGDSVAVEAVTIGTMVSRSLESDRAATGDASAAGTAGGNDETSSPARATTAATATGTMGEVDTLSASATATATGNTGTATATGENITTTVDEDTWNSNNNRNNTTYTAGTTRTGLSISTAGMTDNDPDRGSTAFSFGFESLGNNGIGNGLGNNLATRSVPGTANTVKSSSYGSVSRRSRASELPQPSPRSIGRSPRRRGGPGSLVLSTQKSVGPPAPGERERFSLGSPKQKPEPLGKAVKERNLGLRGHHFGPQASLRPPSAERQVTGTGPEKEIRGEFPFSSFSSSQNIGPLGTLRFNHTAPVRELVLPQISSSNSQAQLAVLDPGLDKGVTEAGEVFGMNDSWKDYKKSQASDVKQPRVASFGSPAQATRTTGTTRNKQYHNLHPQFRAFVSPAKTRESKNNPISLNSTLNTSFGQTVHVNMSSPKGKLVSPRAHITPRAPAQAPPDDLAASGVFSTRKARLTPHTPHTPGSSIKETGGSAFANTISLQAKS